MPPKGRGRGRGSGTAPSSRGRGSGSAPSRGGLFLRRGAELIRESVRKHPRSPSGTSDTSQESSRREMPSEGPETVSGSRRVQETENEETVVTPREDVEPLGTRQERPASTGGEAVLTRTVQNESAHVSIVASPGSQMNRSQVARRGRPMNRVAHSVGTRVGDNPQVVRTGENRERRRERKSEEEERSGSESSQSRESSIDREEGAGDPDQEGEEREESPHDVWDDYLNRKEATRKKQEETEKVWTKTMKKYKDKKDDPWRALLLNTAKQFCGKELEKMFTVFNLDEEDKAQLRRKWRKNVGLKQSSELGRKYVILVDFLMDEVVADSLFKAATRMNLESGWARRHMTTWKAYRVDIATEEPVAVSQIRRELKRRFTHLDESNDEGKQFICLSVKDDTIVSCILTESIKERATGRIQRSYSTVLVAISCDVLNFPYILVHGDGDPDESLLTDISECVGGTSYRYLNLCDIGYNTVLGACKQQTSDEIRASRGREIEENAFTEEQRAYYQTKMIPLSEHFRNKGLPINDDRGIKRKVVSEIMKTEPEEGGIKNLKLEFKKPGTNKGVTFKFLTKKGGSLSANLSKMYETGAVKDGLVDAFLMAKDKKTNNLKLEWSNDDGGKWKPASRN